MSSNGNEDYSDHLIETLRALCTRVLSAPADRRTVLRDIARTVVERLGLVACSIRGIGADGEALMEGYVRGQGPLSAPILEDTPELAALFTLAEIDESQAFEDQQQYTGEGARLGIRSRLTQSFPPESGYQGAITLFSSGVDEASRETRQTLDLIAGQVAIALKLTEYREQEIEQAVLERDIELAARIQRQVVPDAAPDVKGLEITTVYDTYHSVGGDFYDVLTLNDGSACILVGDVAGKGLPAALLMASACAAIRALLEAGISVESLPAILNRQLCEYSSREQMVTLFVCVISRDRTSMRYFNAGHPFPVLATAGGSELLRSTGIPLGLLPDATWNWGARSLSPGDALFAFTDGVAEDANEMIEPAGGTLRAFVESRRGLPMADLQRDLAQLTDNESASDDRTILFVRVADEET